LARRIFCLLIVAAFMGATMLQAAPSFAVSTETYHTAMGGIMHHQDQPGDKMPCKGMPPGCVGDLGCIFLVSLPARPYFFQRDGVVVGQLRHRIARIAPAHDHVWMAPGSQGVFGVRAAAGRLRSCVRPVRRGRSRRP
jgi:hypothetical protein